MRTVKKSHIDGICSKDCMKSHSPFRIRSQGGDRASIADLTVDLSDSMRKAELSMTESQKHANVRQRPLLHQKRKLSKMTPAGAFQQQELKVGSLVWAKDRGIWWPAEITIAADEDEPFGNVEVKLFGEPRVRMNVGHSSLEPFLENAARHNCGKHSSAFRTAVADAMLRASPSKEVHGLECREQASASIGSNDRKKRR
ncbi:unnamed protein product [Closterium sp. Yama58-4]|nr:unnamed protein product [Closterium sp. Yama58-4]